MTEVQHLFVADAQDILDRLYRDLEELRIARTDGRRRRELAAQIFRRIHTLKGSAGTLGFASVGRIAHAFEGVLDGARLGRIELTDAVLEAFEDAMNALAEGLRPSSQQDGDFDVASIIRTLNQLTASSENQGSIAPKLRAALPAGIAHSLSEYDLQHAREAIREGAKLFIVSVVFDLETFDRDFRELGTFLGQSGEIIATIPGEPATVDEISLRLLYAAEFIATETLRQAVSRGRIELKELELADARSETAGVVASPDAPASPAVGVDNSVRVTIKQLDGLISAAAELQRQTTNTLITHSAPSKAEALQDAAKKLRGRFAELEQGLIKLRLVPIGQVFERVVSRVGYSIARQMGKRVEFTIVGSEVGIEKSIAEAITDPLFHLVRNAITHGIEDPQTRGAIGKNPTGHLTLTAANHSGRIYITVTDDGRGIDIERVSQVASESGISGGELSLDQCVRLIFRPGFSTAPEPSQMSGRGIGLDIVDRAMDNAGGETRVATERGAGTTFAMIVPAALSMMRCVLVRAGEQFYAIDSAGLDDTHATITEGGDDHLPLLQLKSLLGQDGDQPNADNPILVWQAISWSPITGAERRAYRLSVDDIIGTQELLVRGLGRYAARWPGLCGAAELLDGTVALVLDLEDLIKQSDAPRAD